jgi:transposase
VVAVIDAEGKIVLETIVATAAAPIRRLIESISGAVHITLEETTRAEWLYELLQRFVAEVVVCDPRRNRLLSEGSKGDKARSEAGGVVADRYGSFGLARTANDAWVEGTRN